MCTEGEVTYEDRLHGTEFTDCDLECSRDDRVCLNTQCLSPTLTITSASAPNSRTCSFKNRQRNMDLLDQHRRNSMPVHCSNQLSVSFNDLSVENTPVHPLRRVRSFKTTSKGGVVNNGDSFRSTGSVTSSGSAANTDTWADQEEHGMVKQERSPSDASDSSNFCSIESTTPSSFYRVAMAGTEGVGITSLMSQLMTSEYMGAYDSIDDDDDRMVSVMLDCEESTMEFVDCGENLEHNIDAYLIIFSITDRKSLQCGIEMIRRLRQDDESDRRIILVANKCDLVRKRQVTTSEARQLATHFDCKYIETSVVLNHNIDELLVGILKQIRLKLDSDLRQESPQHSPNRRNKAKRDSLSKPKELLRKIFKKYSRAVKSCDNLYRL